MYTSAFIKTYLWLLSIDKEFTPLVYAQDTVKVQNQQETKLRFFYLLLIIILIVFVQGNHRQNAYMCMLCNKNFLNMHGRRNRSCRYRSCGTNVDGKVMNFIISDLGSADSEKNQSVNLNMLHVREQDAACKGTICCMWVSANGNKQFSAAQLHNLPIELAYT